MTIREEHAAMIMFVIAIIIAVGFFMWKNYLVFTHSPSPTPSQSSGIINPADAIPKNNPLSGTSNPIKNIYINPLSK